MNLRSHPTQGDNDRDAGKRIVIVGGGFAGTTLARALERRLPPGYRIVLVSEESYTTFNPMLAEVVGASVFPEHVVAPIRQMLRPGSSSQFIMGRVTAVDVARRHLRAQTLAGLQEIDYEHLVLAFGTRANLDLLPGLAQHALPLKLVGDAMHIRNRVLQQVARIELETDPVVRRRLGHFIVIGGGFSGVEVAGALSDFLRGATRYYPRVAPGELQVTVLEVGDRLLRRVARVARPRRGPLDAVTPHHAAPAGTRGARRRRWRAARRRPDPRRRHRHLHDRHPAQSAASNGSRCRRSADASRPQPTCRCSARPASGRSATARWCATARRRPFAPPTAQFAVAQAQALARNIVASHRRPLDPGLQPRVQGNDGNHRPSRTVWPSCSACSCRACRRGCCGAPTT